MQPQRDLFGDTLSPVPPIIRVDFRGKGDVLLTKAADGSYDSEWSYYAVKGDKALVLDLFSPGGNAPPRLAQTMFSALPVGGGKKTKVDGIGDKAIFYHDRSALEMMNILKGQVLVTIGIHGMSAKTALEQEKSIAKKLLAKL